jgi:hypothetical protein
MKELILNTIGYEIYIDGCRDTVQLLPGMKFEQVSLRDTNDNLTFLYNVDTIIDKRKQGAI